MVTSFLIITLILFSLNLLINLGVVFAQNNITVQNSVSIFISLILITMNIVSLNMI